MARSQNNLYALILGLPEDVEDPDHYQILGLPRFTSDVKAIREAAIAQNSKLLKWQNSEHFKDSLRLTQHIVEAKRVLENPESRRAYNRRLVKEEPTDDSNVRQTNLSNTKPRDRMRSPRATQKDLHETKNSEPAILRTGLLIVGCLGLAVVLGLGIYRISRPTAGPSNNEDLTATSHSGPPKILKAPFDEEQAQASQAAWAQSLHRKVSETNSVGMDLVLIPPGEYSMGTPDSNAVIFWDELVQHRVLLEKPFAMSRTEVTQAQWQKVMDTTPWTAKRFVREGLDFPASFVSWSDALAFCQKLTEQERAAGRISSQEEYTLPTEAQWEYACRAGTATEYSFGNEESKLTDAGWHSQASWSRDERYPHRVGQRIPNAFGLYDMHGNVREWCLDWYDSDYYEHSPQENPTGPLQGTRRVHRGGGWSSTLSYCRSAARGKDAPDTSNDDLGFRVVLLLNPNP